MKTLLATISDENGVVLYDWKLDLPIEDKYPSLHDDVWSAHFGEFQSNLLNGHNNCHISLYFSSLGWIDPLPLLAIATSLRGYIEKFNGTLDIYLGDKPSQKNHRRGAFLRFLARHKFLSAFSSSIQPYRLKYIFNDSYFDSIESLADLEQELDRAGFPLTYDDSLCLRTKLVKVGSDKSATTTDSDKGKLVSDFLEEIRDYGLMPLFSTQPEMVDALLYKFRVILYELIENAFEHAFVDDSTSYLSMYFGLYARVRKKTPNLEIKNTRESALSRENSHCPLLQRFTTTLQMNWIEIFYYDPGSGLLADLASWSDHAGNTGNLELQKVLRSLKPTTNKFHKISRYMFNERLSRFPRDGRTVLTGLQHISLVLADTNDFARACVAREWVGGIHPWKDNIQADAINYAKRKEFSDLHNTLGTTWHFNIQIGTEAVKLPVYFAELEDETRHSTIEKSNYPLQHEKSPDWQIIDERGLSDNVAIYDVNKTELVSDIVLWLPGDARKQRVHQWLGVIKSSGIVKKWVIADLPNYQAGPISEILKWEIFDMGISVYIVSEDWSCACLPLSEKTSQSVDRAKHFLHKNTDHLYRLLRSNDSKLFWKDIPTSPPDILNDVPFVYERVYWKGTEGDEVILSGYLELTHALTEPLRANVCRRALSRTWHLFYPGTRCEPTDTLLAGILPAASIRAKSPTSGITSVSSVLVTGSTLSRKSISNLNPIIHLFHHTHVEINGENVKIPKSPIALEWIPTHPKLKDPPAGKLPYQRIPGTPFIGRGGPKAIPIRRFGYPTQNKDGTYNVFKESLYGEAPREMYEHFTRLGILKFGHWGYEGHHDIFTINLGKAYALERIDKGPMVDWLISTFTDLCNDGVRVLIYPSHIITDQIVRDLLTNHHSCLPTHIIPVHFLGLHSQSSIRIPSRTYDRIREILEEEKKLGNSGKVVLFDDGTVTGKVAREMEHLIRNAGASYIYSVVLIDRTGLPLYRKLIISTRDKRKAYWRWDVPVMGSRRTCPLCRAVDQARLINASMSDSPAKNRIAEWIDLWQLKDVVLDWDDHGLSPRGLPNIRRMTFGKEWLPNDNVLDYEVDHTTTTGIAAMVVELIRTTAYKGVGIKIADEPGGASYIEAKEERSLWDHVKLEILIGQIFLFFDDFDGYEINERLNRVFSILFRRTVSEKIDTLAGLMLLLVDEENALTTFKYLLPILSQSKIISLDAELALGYMIVKSKYNWLDLFEPENTADMTETEGAMLRENLMYAWQPYARRKKDPISIQRTSFLLIVLLLGDTRSTMHCGFLRKRTVEPANLVFARLISDISMLKEALSEINQLLYNPANKLVFDPNKDLKKLIEWHNELGNNGEYAFNGDLINKLHDYLFGENGLAGRFQDETIMSVKVLSDFLELKGRYDEFYDLWKLELETKAKRDDNKNIIKRWEIPGGYRLPEISIHVHEGIEQIMLLTPPLVQQVILDNIMNVAHSPGSYDDETGIDLHIDITYQDNHICLNMKALCNEDSKVPEIKANENMMTSLLGSTVNYKLINENDEKWVLQSEIQIPTISSLGRVTI